MFIIPLIIFQIIILMEKAHIYINVHCKKISWGVFYTVKLQADETNDLF